jgi:hypothetical protein
MKRIAEAIRLRLTYLSKETRPPLPIPFCERSGPRAFNRASVVGADQMVSRCDARYRAIQDRWRQGAWPHRARRDLALDFRHMRERLVAEEDQSRPTAHPR